MLRTQRFEQKEKEGFLKMLSTENQEAPTTDFFEKVANPNFSLLKFKKRIDEYKNKKIKKIKKLIIKNVFAYFVSPCFCFQIGALLK